MPTATTPAAPVFPPGRYGRRREPQRRRPWLVAGLALVTVVVGALVAVRLYKNYGDPAYDAQVVNYTEIDDSGLTLRFRVTIPEGGQASCLLRARSRDGADVGKQEIVVRDRPGDGTTAVTQRLVTSARPFVGEVLRCVPVA
ncbi:DUF4307 domain-containing protein [Asanoa sp. WMMD1127]|uniref:DUF4307 domain-containing protein n=1 Tax=Asanoa sp. WMMD1127 TaxID=3016107 RepID=UPI002415A018|nr:DUF4307 domain-containing protein [Asanoa sp. WMMD1127]MDG4820976.1 DUF4307 domain-containing protein [Asanoa sp. WMMD1127]